MLGEGNELGGIIIPFHSHFTDDETEVELDEIIQGSLVALGFEGRHVYQQSLLPGSSSATLACFPPNPRMAHVQQ